MSEGLEVAPRHYCGGLKEKRRLDAVPRYPGDPIGNHKPAPLHGAAPRLNASVACRTASEREAQRVNPSAGCRGVPPPWAASWPVRATDAPRPVLDLHAAEARQDGRLTLACAAALLAHRGGRR